MSAPSESPTPPLTRSEAGEVLRYWLASLQLEEALSVRPRARRSLAEVRPPRMDAPSGESEYFKVSLDDALVALLCERAPLKKPFDGELGAFFEAWLLSQYRRPDDDRRVTHLLAFPVVHLARGELAGLLRYGLRLTFGTPEGSAFRVPSRDERRHGRFPEPPSEVCAAAAERGKREWPFFLDTRLLQRELGVARENIDVFFAELRKKPEVGEGHMLAAVCALLESELGGEFASRQAPTPAQSPARIAEAMGRLLARRGGRARVYPVGIVLDGTRAKSTFYLQREIQSLIEERPWRAESCLGAYLMGKPMESAKLVQRALFPGPPLSPSQREVAEYFWGSRLTAAQGPPGTGKTTLILHLTAEVLVQKVDALIRDGSMGDAVLVVTSTNNRAVDNVVDPLTATSFEGLPLALRVGSRRVCEHVLLPQLTRTRAWLERAKQRPPSEREDASAAAKRRFEEVRVRGAETWAPRARALKNQVRREELRRELASLGSAPSEPPAPEIDAELHRALKNPLKKLRPRLGSLSQKCEGAASRVRQEWVEQLFESGVRRQLEKVSALLTAAGIPVAFSLPPRLPPRSSPDAALEAWEEAAEDARRKIDALQHVRRNADIAQSRRADSAARERELQTLEAELGADELPQNGGDVDRELFEAAVLVREAWAAARADTLLEAVDGALEIVRRDSSLRGLWTDDRRSWNELRRLFGVWGCTLLSLGNCFPAEAESIDRLIVDEAGQCHPAYAVSGLLRSRSAMIVGDVHQLEPVIDLEPDDAERVVQQSKIKLSAAALAPYRVHATSRTSVQALADRASRERPMLSDHFRCQPEIIAVCDALCGYGLRVHTPRQGPAAPLPFLPHPLHFVDVVGEQERQGGSWKNVAEIALIVELCQAILAAGTDPGDIAIITPYRGQLEELRKQLVHASIPLDSSVETMDLEDAPRSASRGVALGTVHRFQGGERSVVLFTSVVTRRASLGFLDDRENLLNVAVSRARHRFVVVGDRALLEAGERTRLLVHAATVVEPGAFRLQLGLAFS